MSRHRRGTSEQSGASSPAVHELDPTAFHHEALLYEGDDGFLGGTLPFVRGAIAAEEPILIAVSARRIALLKEALGADADRVRFANMAELGANPARIIPAWQEFVVEHAARGRRLRGIGEPIWAGRSGAELDECHRHEALLNLAFADAKGFRLMCPYDTSALAPDVVAEAARNHPHVRSAERVEASPAWSGLEEIAAPHRAPLSPPPADAFELSFDLSTMAAARAEVARRASAAGLNGRTDDLVLAVSELLTNSVRHGGGAGTLTIWRDGGAVICEVYDHGTIRDRPLVGRERPLRGQLGGYGLWLVNQLCDLVQLRTVPTGNVVRAHMRLAPACPMTPA